MGETKVSAPLSLVRGMHLVYYWFCLYLLYDGVLTPQFFFFSTYFFLFFLLIPHTDFDFLPLPSFSS